METEVSVNNCGLTDSRPSYNENHQRELLYKLEDRTPFVFTFFSAIQILLCQIAHLLWLPVLLSSSLCILPADPICVYLVSTAFLVSGVVTTIQSTLGIRLATVATPSVLYASCFLSLLQKPSLQCPSNGDLYSMGHEERTLQWQLRLREVQGGLLFAGVLQALLAFSGLQACLCRILGPVAVAPAVFLAGLTIPHQPLALLEANWTLFSIVAFFVILFALGLRAVCLPLPTFSIHSGLTAKCFPVFRMFSVLWTCVAVYVIYRAEVMFEARTTYPDTTVVGLQEAVDNSKWFFFPFPFEWGLPTLSLSTAVQMLPTVLLQSLTSHLLFFATAESCELGKPPRSAVSRGLGVEGLGLIFGSMWGHGVTTSLDNIGLMPLSGVASRNCTQLAALMMIALSHFTQVTGMLANIPIQFLSVLQLCLHASFISVGIRILRFINFKSSRDCAIIGFCILLGMVVPQWVSDLSSSLDTGSAVLDSFITQTLKSSVFVGATSGCLLDLILPGRVSRKKSRLWPSRSEEDKKSYQLPTWEELLCSALERSPFFSTS